MAVVRLIDRLDALAPHRRWILGLIVSGRMRRIDAALVGARGSGLAAHAEVFAHHSLSVDPKIVRRFAHFREARRVKAAQASLLAAHLAEREAQLIDQMASLIAPVRDRLLAVAVHEPGVWGSAGGLIYRVGLSDAARLADQSGHNVIDAFAARDLAQDGRGRPLLPIPYWMLLRDARRTRVLLRGRGNSVLVYLPSERDASGAARVLHRRMAEDQPPPCDGLAQRAARAIVAHFPSDPPIDQLVVGSRSRAYETWPDQLHAPLEGVRVLGSADLGIEPDALAPAGVAVLGLLHLDQTPAASSVLTGARTPRVLGRLTPGSLANWHRLVHELAAAKPSVVSLRSAV